MTKSIAVFGSSGAIGGAFTQQLASRHPNATICAFSRRPPAALPPNASHFVVDYASESSIEQAALQASSSGPIDVAIVATGVLHAGDIQPEKSLRDISAEKLNYLFAANAVFPALVAKHVLPKLSRDTRSVFAALSAHAGSISDNDMGGWYAYRAAKAALNMLIKNAAIEIGRRNKQAVIVGLHPGTVDSDLSEPFKRSVPADKLFTPDFAVEKMLAVLDDVTPQQSGKCFEWDGTELRP